MKAGERRAWPGGETRPVDAWEEELDPETQAMVDVMDTIGRGWLILAVLCGALTLLAQWVILR